MDTFEKLSSLRLEAAFEDAEITAMPEEVPAEPNTLVRCPIGSVGGEDHPCDPVYPIYMATLPGGKRIPVLKTLLTSACERNCYYCFARAGRDTPRQTFHPEELAQAFFCMYRKGAVQGILLSSGIAGGGTRTQDRLLAVAEILRNKMEYRGYLHLKLMPGVERAQVERAMQLADRVSINLEAPTTQHLSRLAPMKQLAEELVRPLQWVEEIRRNQPPWYGWRGRWPSSTTQFVVGAAGESDLDLLHASEYLHRRLRLSRVYFSGFAPVPGTPLENHPPVDPRRRVRLYQADFLLRDYGFSFSDFIFLPDGTLPLESDPKLLWAQTHLAEAPLEINRATFEELLRVPGIGPKSVKAILSARRCGRLRSLGDLKVLGVQIKRAAPFILLDGRQPVFQLKFW